MFTGMVELAKLHGVSVSCDECERRAQESLMTPNVRAKLAPTVGRAGPVGENVQGTADRARVARRWGSA